MTFRPTIGELFAGYGGLGMAVQSVYNAELAWVSDIDGGACKILRHRFPAVPNLGDIKAVDWPEIEPVNILTGGFPCQDVSGAGKRAGIRPDTRSGLWSQFAYAISQLNPELVVIENVQGLLSAKAHSDVEPCAWCVGEDTDGALRALGAVLGDLAELGYDAEWCGLPASAVGAPHGRFRVFVVAYPQCRGLPRWPLEPQRRPLGRAAATWGGEGARLLPTPTGDDASNLTRDSGEFQSLTRTVMSLLPTPRAREMEESVESFSSRQERMADAGRTKGDSGMPLSVAINLLPTPAVNDMGAGKTVEDWDAWTDRMKAEHGNGNGHGASLEIEAKRLASGPHRYARVRVETEGPNPPGECCGAYTQSWKVPDGDDYGPAVRRWHDFTRCVPPPSEIGPKGQPQLSGRFDEWLMGLPQGWITDVPDITRNEVLRACGNGVVPQQAEAALRWLLEQREAVA